MTELHWVLVGVLIGVLSVLACLLVRDAIRHSFKPLVEKLRSITIVIELGAGETLALKEQGALNRANSTMHKMHSQPRRRAGARNKAAEARQHSL